jgi:hypothetical protein
MASDLDFEIPVVGRSARHAREKLVEAPFLPDRLAVPADDLHLFAR